MKTWKEAVSSSPGKKLFMSLTGLCFCGFLAGHLAGNLTLFGGRSAFNAYAEKLHSLGHLLTVVELGLLVLAIVHVAFGLTLFVQNRLSRPVRYQVDRRAGGRSLGSATMPYTGILLLCFVIFHLMGFSFVDKTGTSIHEIVSAAFQKPATIFIYVAAVLLAGVHVSHGFWSAFQSLGLNHPKYMPLVRGVGLLFAIIVAVGFGALPIFVRMTV